MSRARRRPDERGYFRPDIEGLRAVAVIGVLLYHAGVPGFPGGFVGVDVFYVISGFLITGLLLREIGSNGRISLTRFYARRMRRLLPAALWSSSSRSRRRTGCFERALSRRSRSMARPLPPTFPTTASR